MAEKNRASSLAIVRETTAGTPVAPTAGTQFVALQAGFSLKGGFALLDNNELRASIGEAKKIQGIETPTGAYSHYLRHSGVEGQAPNYGLMLEGLLGATSSNATERTTTVGSTVSVVNLAAGGSDFTQGKALLVKDGANGYEIRPVESVSTNNVTLGFNLGFAPATGVSVGKCVNYAPATNGHPTFTAWLYRGGGGALEVEAGARVTQGAFSVKAGELVNTNFTFQSTKYYFDPINITATDKYLDFTDDDGTFAAVITAQLYRQPYEFAQALQDALNGTASTKTYVVSYSSTTGKFTITSNSTLLSLLWNTGLNTANTVGDKMGFSVAADSTGNAGSVGYSSATAQNWAPTLTPSYDSADPNVAKSNEVLIGDAVDLSCFCASSMDITITNEITQVKCVCADSGVQDQVLNKRKIDIKIVGILERHDADKFKRFIGNSDVKFMYNMGQKSGGNWVPGTCVSMYAPKATISAFEAGDDNGLVTMNISISPYVPSDGSGEFYINFL